MRRLVDARSKRHGRARLREQQGHAAIPVATARPQEHSSLSDTPTEAEPHAAPNDSPRATLSFTGRFLAILALIAIVLYLDDAVWNDALVQPLTEVSAQFVSWNLTLFGMETVLDGSSIEFEGHGFSVVADCIGLEVLGLFVAAVLAVPATFAHKLKGIGMGVPVLIFINHVRMMTLVVLGGRWTEWLDIGHVYIWPMIVILVAIGLWLSWIRIIRDDSRLLA